MEEVNDFLLLGVLSLPYVCKLCGLAFGLIMLLLGYVAALWGFYMIIKTNEKGGKFKSYKDLYETMGGKGLLRFYNIVVIFTMYGCLTGYQVIIATLMQRILKDSRSEECRVGKECTSWCSSRWSPHH